MRRSLKEEKRLQAEKRGEMDLRIARWEVSFRPLSFCPRTARRRIDIFHDSATRRSGYERTGLTITQQNGKQGEPKNLLTVNEAAFKEAAGKEAQ